MQGPTAPSQAVVLDTNVVLDWLVFADPRAQGLRHAIDRSQVHWLATLPMLDELANVLQRPLGPRWDRQRERTLSQWPLNRAVLVDSPPASRHGLQCSDSDDQKFLDLALHHGVRWLVTRDRALLALRRAAGRRGLAILQPVDWPVPVAV